MISNKHVMGGWFLAVFLPSMSILWYVIIFLYCTRTHACTLIGIASTGIKTEWIEKKCTGKCATVFYITALYVTLHTSTCTIIIRNVDSLLGAPFVGVVVQLGIGIVTGNAIYRVRVIENTIIMTVISIFAFVQFECDKCADADTRYALDNQRILSWVSAGWFAVMVHLIVSVIMTKMIDKDYDFDVTKLIDEIQTTLDRDRIERKKSAQLVRALKLKGHFPRCVKCGDKTIPLRASDFEVDKYHDASRIKSIGKCRTGKCEESNASQVLFRCQFCEKSICMTCSDYQGKDQALNRTLDLGAGTTNETNDGKP